MSSTERKRLLIAGGVLIAALAPLVFFKVITTAEAINITVVSFLVFATFMYVKRTAETADAAKQQADASVRMAEEMRDAKYDALRPIIDIQVQRMDPMSLARIGYGELPQELSCVLCNIGLGPATDVYSFIQPPSSKRQRYDFVSNTLATRKKTEEMSLSLNQENDRKALVAYYKDVYGRGFESSREVSAVKETREWKLGPLKIRKIAEEELPK